MKPYTVLALLITIGSTAFSQKPALDTSVFSDWPFVTNLVVSNNGNYVMYNIRRKPFGVPAGEGTLIIQSVQKKWKQEITGVNVGSVKAISANSKLGFFFKSDSLGTVAFYDGKISYIPGVSTFKLCGDGALEHLIYQLKGPSSRLVLRNLSLGTEQYFDKVTSYQVSAAGKAVVLKKDSVENGVAISLLYWVNLAIGVGKVIYKGYDAENIVFSNTGNAIAFTTTGSAGTYLKNLWLYNKNKDETDVLLNNKDIPDGMELNGISFFSRNDESLFVTLTERKGNPDKGGVSVDVWSYQDAVIQSEQLESGSGHCMAVVNLADRRLIVIQKEFEMMPGYASRQQGNMALVVKRKGNIAEWNWNREAQPEYFLVDKITGQRKKIDYPSINWSGELSPMGKFVLINDGIGTALYTYDAGVGSIRDIAADLAVPVGGEEFDKPVTKKSRGLSGAAWLQNDAAVLVYDEYDIWQIDPTKRNAPKCLTNGFGRKNKVTFRFSDLKTETIFADGQEIIVTAFNWKNKDGGFYKIRIGKVADPERLSIGAYDYSPNLFEADLFKARDAGIYIVRRQSATESPNFFYTKDFKSFTPLSDVHPEKQYNWLTAELISFQTVDGRAEQAILYKPENFDSRKKYPVILSYYERKTQELNIFKRPVNETGGELDVAWFVSHGYVVVLPDIHFNIGEPGNSAYNSIVGAANHLASLPWIDKSCMGIQGHSFGGYETNYVITHTGLFAAACSSSGLSDLVSNYLGFLGEHSNYDLLENRVTRMGVTLWQQPELYVKNSPVFRVDKITTPLLTVSNKKDKNVEFSQGAEMFNAMRRLGKTVWMLQYDGEGHGVGGNAYVDYIIRMTQFFDHYLKHSPAPRWMLEGVPAKRKGIDNGYELDTTGKKPGPGLLKEPGYLYK